MKSAKNLNATPGFSCCISIECYGRALGSHSNFYFFVLATFYLEISTFITRNFEIKSRIFDFHNSKFRVKKSKISRYKVEISSYESRNFVECVCEVRHVIMWTRIPSHSLT